MPNPIFIKNRKFDFSRNQNYYVYSAMFEGMSNRSIDFEKDDCDFLLSFSNFEKCIASQSVSNGGTIMFKGNSSFVQYRVCASECKLSKHGIAVFCYSILTNTTSRINYIHDSCISNCGTKGICDGIIHCDFGNCDVKNMNSSKNFAGATSGIGIKAAANESIFRFSQCDFDISSGNNVLYFSGGKFIVNFCNILNCSQSSIERGIITCHDMFETHAFVIDCCIVDNKGPYTFYGQIDVIRCYSPNFTTKGSVNTTIMSTYQFVNNIEFINFGDCIANFEINKSFDYGNAEQGNAQYFVIFASVCE